MNSWPHNCLSLAFKRVLLSAFIPLSDSIVLSINGLDSALGFHCAQHKWIGLPPRLHDCANIPRRLYTGLHCVPWSLGALHPVCHISGSPASYHTLHAPYCAASFALEVKCCLLLSWTLVTICLWIETSWPCMKDVPTILLQTLVLHCNASTYTWSLLSLSVIQLEPSPSMCLRLWYPYYEVKCQEWTLRT